MEPDDFEIMAYVYAIESYNDFERYGNRFPYSGGLMDQPWAWKCALDCVMDALNAARSQAHAEAKNKA
jgi:hypothetical protein